MTQFAYFFLASLLLSVVNPSHLSAQFRTRSGGYIHTSSRRSGVSPADRTKEIQIQESSAANQKNADEIAAINQGQWSMSSADDSAKAVRMFQILQSAEYNKMRHIKYSFCMRTEMKKIMAKDLLASNYYLANIDVTPKWVPSNDRYSHPHADSQGERLYDQQVAIEVVLEFTHKEHGGIRHEFFDCVTDVGYKDIDALIAKG